MTNKIKMTELKLEVLSSEGERLDLPAFGFISKMSES